MESRTGNRRQVTRIDVLPDDVLLEIFHFCTNTDNQYDERKIKAWESLVNVCRRWRGLVFESPRRLNLQLYCTPERPIRDTLDAWPALPLIVMGTHITSLSITDNITAALGQTNRVCRVNLSGWQLEEVLAVMQVPFPELTELRVDSLADDPPAAIPDSFLGGSAPRLRVFELYGIPFPGLPNLLLSAVHLVQLWIGNIPHSGYVSPETMVAVITVLSSLETLNLGFESPQSRPNWEARRSPPSKRSVIPALESFSFEGVVEYLEDLVAFIDAPQLNNMHVTLFDQINFDAPRLAQFINRTPTLRTLDEAHMKFGDGSACVLLAARPRCLGIEIRCRGLGPDRQLSSVAQICASSLPPPFKVGDLYIDRGYSELVWQIDAIESNLWLELLLSFPAVKNLYLCKEFAPSIAAALQELSGARVTQVMPGLQNIFVRELEPPGPFQESIGEFAAARHHSGHPIAISVSNRYGIWGRPLDINGR